MATFDLSPEDIEAIADAVAERLRAADPARPPGSADPLLTETQLAAMLKLETKQKFQCDRKAGKGIPFLKIGRLIRYRTSDVEAYLAKCERTNTVKARP